MRLVRRLLTVVMDPGAVLADVGHFDQVRIQSGDLGRLAEGLQMHVRRAGRDHHGRQSSRDAIFWRSSDWPGSLHMYL